MDIILKHVPFNTRFSIKCIKEEETKKEEVEVPEVVEEVIEDQQQVEENCILQSAHDDFAFENSTDRSIRESGDLCKE